MTYWHMLTQIGAWAQAHQSLVLAVSATLIVVLGMARLTWRTALHARRRWR